MATINLTNNTDVQLVASSADDNATLNRYLTSPFSLQAAPSLEPLLGLLVGSQSPLGFPIVVSATGEGKFALEHTTVDVQVGASASIGLLQGRGEADFLSGVSLASEPSSSGLVSFAVAGTLIAGPGATVGDFTFGITNNTTVTLTSYYEAAAGDKLVDAVQRAVAALTIPHDLDDLQSIPEGAICRLDAASTLKFSASFTYSFLNDPLAAVAIENLPSLGINATAAATIEGTATHTSDHTLTIAKLPNGILHLAVSLTKTDDLETSLTVSSGVAADIGSTDALAFLLDRINPNSAAEAEAIAAEMPDAAQFKADIKAAIDKSLSAALAVSLKGALETSDARNHAFVFEIDPAALDGVSKPALQAALTGDFTALTKDGAQLNGIRRLDESLTTKVTDTQTFTVHFLGIFNAVSIHQFIAKSKVDVTSDTHELVLSDETLQVVDNNLDAEKLRKLVLKDITLTLPASANTPEAANPITLAYVDREGKTSPAKLRQFANALQAVGASSTAAAEALVAQKLKDYGTCSLFLGLNLTPPQCRSLFVDGNGKAYDWMRYLNAMCAAEKVIYAGLEDDPENAYHLKLFAGADEEDWKGLADAGDVGNMTPILRDLGMSEAEVQLAATDAFTAIWWSEAMADFATALVGRKSLAAVGKEIVEDANLGYSEPWMILTTWSLAGRPAITADFGSSRPAVSAAAPGKSPAAAQKS